jgi:hypothetical protein
MIIAHYKYGLDENGNTILISIEYYEEEVVELTFEQKYEIRKTQIFELDKYFREELTNQQYTNYLNTTRNHKEDWLAGSPRLRLYYENGQDSEWSTNFTTNGYEQTTYYTLDRKNKALEILQFIY